MDTEKNRRAFWIAQALEPTKQKVNCWLYWLGIMFAIGWVAGVFTASEFMVRNIR